MSRIALAVLLVLVATTAGCGGGRAPEPITGSAGAASIPTSAVSEAGFTATGTARVPYNTSGSLAVSGDVQLDFRYRLETRTWRATYASDGGSPPTVVGVWSVPVIEPEEVDARIDPTEGLTVPSLVMHSQTSYTAAEDISHRGNGTATMLGRETTVRRYDASAVVDGDRIEVTVHVAAVEHGGDVVSVVAVHPRDRDASGAVLAMIEAVRH